jgi:hypothetical protein
MKKLALLAPGVMIASSLAMVPSFATAQESGLSIYGGGGIGYFRLNDDEFLDEDDDFKDNRTGWRAQIGTQINPIFSLEGGYVDFGDLNDGALEFSSDGAFAAALVHVPIGSFAPFAKIGQLWWDVDRDAPGSGLFPQALSSTRSGNDTFYGVGVRIGEGPGLQLRIEYDRMEVDNADIDMGSVNVQYRF